MIKLTDRSILLTGINRVQTHRGEALTPDALEYRVAYLEPEAMRAVAHLAAGEEFGGDLDLHFSVLAGTPLGIRCIDILVKHD